MAVKDQLVLLVDVTTAMFRRDSSEVPFLQCMEVRGGTMCASLCVCVYACYRGIRGREQLEAEDLFPWKPLS